MKFTKHLVVLTSILLLFTGCKLIDGWTHFKIEYYSTVTLPQDLDINKSVDVYPAAVATDLEAEVESEGYDLDKIESVELEDLKLSIVSPSGKNFQFLNSVELYMNAEGQEEVKVAWLNEVPTNATDKLDLKTSSKNLKSYAKEEMVTFRLSTVMNQGISSDYLIGIDVTFLVDVKILGI